MHLFRPSRPRRRISRRAARLQGVSSTRSRSTACAEHGQALVEFALILPILLLVLFGIVQFGLALNSANDATHVANEVARYAIINENPSAKSLQEWGREQLYTNYTNALNTPGKVCIRFPNAGKHEIGDPVLVEVTSTTNWIPILQAGPSTVLKGTAYMRLEATPTYTEGCNP
jgi:uncharacterized protein (UPF0333 family)